MTLFNDEENQSLDRVIESRRTIRKFKAESPPRDAVEKVIQAGLLAPYAKAAVTREDFRRFVVIPRESATTQLAISMLKEKVAEEIERLERRMRQDDYARSHGGPYMERLRAWGERGPPNIGRAPYYIVVAEQKGIPAVEEQSLGHCLENMWLKATALGLSLQPVSITEEMTEERSFCDLIGIPFGEYRLNGCLLGYPDGTPAPLRRSSLDEVTSWL